MSIFTRSNPQQATAPVTPEKVAEAAGIDMPGTAAGVLPPPTAPVYSTRPAEPRAQAESGASLAEKVRMARQQQQAVGERVRAGVQRAKVKTAMQTAPQQPPATTATTSVARASSMIRYPFDPVTCAQTGLLNLAWRWQEAGAPIRAIHTYIELLTRYPHTPAAAAAVSDLVQLSEKLADQGQFHIALAIYDHLEYLA